MSYAVGSSNETKVTNGLPLRIPMKIAVMNSNWSPHFPYVQKVDSDIVDVAKIISDALSQVAVNKLAGSAEAMNPATQKVCLRCWSAAAKSQT
eukprot:SAG31_NODE_2161_length_6297_cov_1.823169_6_plen_93_part_00